MSGSVSGGVLARPGSKAGPPSRVQRDGVTNAFGLPQSIGCRGGWPGGDAARRRVRGDADRGRAGSELLEAPLVVAELGRVALRIAIVGRMADDLHAADA